MGLTVQFLTDRNRIHTGPGFPFLNILRPNYGMRPLFTGNPPVYADPATPVAWVLNTAYAVGAIAVDGNNNVQRVIAIAGTGTSGATAPTWSTVIGGTVVDNSGSNQITWMNTGPSWIPATSAAVSIDQQNRDSNNNIQVCIQAGTTGGTLPTWSTIFGGITVDGTAQWQNLGPTLASGAVTGDIVWDVKVKTLEIDTDQYTSPLDERVIGEAATISGTLRQLTMDVVALSIPNASYSSGTDPAFPTGVQDFYEMGFGGQLRTISPCVCIVSPRPNVADSYYRGWFNRCVPDQGFSIPLSLKKVSDFKVQWKGLAVTSFPAGYQIGRLVEN